MPLVLICTLIILFYLVFIWFIYLIASRPKNIKYRNYCNKNNLYFNWLLQLFYIIFGILSLILFIDQNYNFALIIVLLANIFSLVSFIFNKMYQPLGDNVGIITQQQMTILKLNNLKLIVALPKFKTDKNGRILMDISLRVLMPVAHWNDEYDQQNIIMQHLYNFALKDIFENSFYNKYILKAVFLSEQAVLFKLIQK